MDGVEHMFMITYTWMFSIMTATLRSPRRLRYIARYGTAKVPLKAIGVVRTCSVRSPVLASLVVRMEKFVFDLLIQLPEGPERRLSKARVDQRGSVT